MNQPFKTPIVFLCLLVLPCAAQGQSRSLSSSSTHAPSPIQVYSKATLTASDSTHNAEFGSSSAINTSGDTIVVGAPGQTGTYPYAGSVYVFVKPPTGWASGTQTAELAVSGSLYDSEFGYAVAMSSDGNTIVASRTYDAGGGTVFVFAPTGGSWSNGGTLLAQLTASDSAASNVFGSSVAISGNGDTIVVGAYGDNNEAGAVYVYSEPAGGWVSATETATLTASDPVSRAGLGTAVAISGDTIAAGASGLETYELNGAVYVYTKPASGWTNATQTAALSASDPDGSDVLGSSVGIFGNTIVAGDPNQNIGSDVQAGALYVFVKPSSGWVNAFQTAELTASNGGGMLGASVAIDGNFILGGAPCHDVGANMCQGEVYAYVKPAAGWANSTETYDLSARLPEGGVGASSALTTTGPIAISGAPGYDSEGAVYVFEK